MIKWIKSPIDYLQPEPSYNVEAHLKLVQGLHAKYPLNTPEKCEKHVIEILRRFTDNKDFLNSPLLDQVGHVVSSLFEENDIHIPCQPTIQYRSYLYRLQAILTDKQWIKTAEDGVVTLLRDVIVPRMKSEGPYQVPFYSMFPYPKSLPTDIRILLSDVKRGELEVFERTHNKLVRNIIEASGHTLQSYEKGKKLVSPSDNPKPPEDVIRTYLHGTPFDEIFFDAISLEIPHKLYAEHASFSLNPGTANRRQ